MRKKVVFMDPKKISLIDGLYEMTVEGMQEAVKDMTVDLY